MNALGALSRGCLVGGLAVILATTAASPGESLYDPWPMGPPTDPSFFPIAVWLQAPANAPAYKAAGFNIYIGLWQGPTDQQLADLAAEGMYVICSQNATGLAHVNDPTIIAWLHHDEPDNAQSDGAGGYNSPLPPFDDTPWNTNPPSHGSVYSRYVAMKANDATRPVFLNLGQGVAWDGWWGRGVRTNHPEDYPQYIQGADIVSFDIYPGASGYAQTKDKFWLPAFGVDRLVQWSGPDQPVWNIIESTDIGGHGRATPHQVRMEAWSSLIHGSAGLCYFAHVIGPVFDEPGLLHDPVMLQAVTELNGEIRSLAPVLNSPTHDDGALVVADNPDAIIDTMVKVHDGATYLFAVAMRDQASWCHLQAPGVSGPSLVEVIGEDRILLANDGIFQDHFDGFEVHLYRLAPPPAPLAGDADGDGDVDLADFVILKNNFGAASGATWSDGDFDGDGDVDLADFVILKNNVGAAR